MRSDHYQFKVIANEAIGKKILRCVYLELMDKNTFEIPFLLLSYCRIFNDFTYLLVENLLFLLSESSSFLFE